MNSTNSESAAGTRRSQPLCLILCIGLLLLLSTGGSTLAKESASQDLVEGIMPYQVFPRRGMVGDIAFTAITPEPLGAEVIRSSDNATVTGQQRWPQAGSGKSFVIKDVPVGGEYTIRFKSGDRVQQIEHVLVGDIWIVGGQSNAVGTEHLPPDPVPQVHFFKGDHWQEGRDPLFPPLFPIPGGKTYVPAWQRAAIEYHKRTGIPVGILGWAFGGVPMARFWNWEARELPDFKNLVGKHGKGASAFLFYQGEHDANLQCIPAYKERLKAMAPVMRGYASNPDLVMVVFQLSYFTDLLGRSEPYFGRLREIQRQVCAEDPRAVLIPALPYTHCDVVHLDFEGYGALARQVGECMAEIATSGTVTWQGPRVVGAEFCDEGRRRIRVTFDSVKELRVLDKPLGVPAPASPRLPVVDWYVTDSEHLGYAEITSSTIRDGVLHVGVAGSVLTVDAARLTSGSLSIPLQQTGYIQPSSVTVEGLSVILELPVAAQPDAKVSYGLMNNSLCTLVDERGRPAATFADFAVK
jgi:hypothetical protein